MITNNYVNLFHKKLKSLFEYQTLTLAVSGGVDSMVLLHLFKSSKVKFKVAHYNHNLNKFGDFYQKTVEDVIKSSDSLIEYRAFNAGEQFRLNSKNFETRARKARYNDIAKFADENAPCPIIVTGHNMDDQIENILMGISRGVPIDKVAMAELTYFKKSGVHIYRPMLRWLKKDIREYAAYNNLTWVEDVTNTDQSYERNFYRHTIIPTMMTKRNVYKGISKSIPTPEYIEVEESGLFSHFI